MMFNERRVGNKRSPRSGHAHAERHHGYDCTFTIVETITILGLFFYLRMLPLSLPYGLKSV